MSDHSQNHRGISTHLHRLFHERERQIVHQFVGIIYSVGILADDPDHSSLRLWLIQGIQVLAKRRDDTLILAGIPSEDVLDDDNGLLDDIRDFRLDEV